MQHRKQTAFKKSRKFGDVMGGRTRPKLADNVFNRKHNLLPPSENQEKPIFILENPSKDFYFPVTLEEVKSVLSKLPTEHTEFITHIWFKKVKKKDYLKGDAVQAEFITGSGVYLIKMYAVPANNQMLFGQRKPNNKQLTFYKPYCTNLQHNQKGWFLQWEQAKLKQYFLEKLLLYEIGHCVDYVYQRRWSHANAKQIEDFADNYATIWCNKVREDSTI
jgi:hypothetical protein